MSRKTLLKFFGIVAIVIGFAIFIKLFFFDPQAPTFGSLQVDSIPKTAVVLNNKEIGQTPFTLEKLKPGEYSLSLKDWQTKIKIGAGTLTHVSRELGPTDEKSAGQVLTLEKLPTDKSELAIVTDPDGATILVDGLEKGKASTIFKDIAVGDHTIVASFIGYADQVLQGRLIAGYRLNAVLKLRKLDIAQTPLIEPVPVASVSAQVLIKETPVGYLRVRSLPNLTASESGKVLPGEKYPFISQQDNWVQISKGWVSKDYVEITQ